MSIRFAQLTVVLLLTDIRTLPIIHAHIHSILKTLGVPSLIPDRFLYLQTNNVDELQEKISWSRPHHIELLSRHSTYVSRLSYVPLAQMSVGHLSTSTAVKDSLGVSESAFIVLLVVRGMAKQRMGKTNAELSQTTAAVHSPGQTAIVKTEGHFEGLSISIRRETLIRELENHLGGAVSAPVEFTSRLDMTTLAGIRVWQNTLALCEILKQGVRTPQKLLAAQDAQRLMISNLIDSHRHNYTRLMHRVAAAGPWQVRAAEEFIRAHPAEPLSLGDLASITGVSARTLQHSFRQHRGMSPMQFLRAIRLQCVHDDLLWDGNTRTVAEAAAKWGFYHFGRFAAAYAKRHGETPSETLRRRRTVL